MNLVKRGQKEWAIRNSEESELKYKNPIASNFPAIVDPGNKDWGLIFDEDKYIQVGCIDRTGILKATYHLCLIRLINQHLIKDYYTEEAFDPQDKISPIIEIKKGILEKYSGRKLAEKLLNDMDNSIVIVHKKNSRGTPVVIGKTIDVKLWRRMDLVVENIDDNSMLAIDGVHLDEKVEKLFKEHGLNLETTNNSNFFNIFYRKFLQHLSIKYHEKCPCGKELNYHDEFVIARIRAYLNRSNTFELAWDETTIFVMDASCGVGGIGNSTGNGRAESPDIVYKINLTDEEIAYVGFTKDEYSKHQVTWNDADTNVKAIENLIKDNFFEGCSNDEYEKKRQQQNKTEDPITDIVIHQFDTPLNVKNLFKDCNLKTINIITRRTSQRTDPYTRDRALSNLYKEKISNCQNPNCNKLLYILDKNKNVYYVGDTHHTIWLSKGGLDIIGNIVVLCPFCHRNIHVCDWEQITEENLKYIAERNMDLIISNYDYNKIEKWMPTI